MTGIDTQALAVQAIQQARLLKYQAELAANVATAQAVALLLKSELSHRQIAKLTGISKSQVGRREAAQPPLGVLRSPNGDGRVYDFADEFIWGGSDVASAVIGEFFREETEPPAPGGQGTEQHHG